MASQHTSNATPSGQSPSQPQSSQRGVKNSTHRKYSDSDLCPPGISSRPSVKKASVHTKNSTAGRSTHQSGQSNNSATSTYNGPVLNTPGHRHPNYFRAETSQVTENTAKLSSAG